MPALDTHADIRTAASHDPLQRSLFGDADALGYGVAPIYDEMVNGRGGLRAHWQTFLGALGPLDPEIMSERWEEARRLLHQNGVTYNIYGDPQGMERPWPLDMIPLILPADEWEEIESGVIQRARLMNAVLADLYGPQSLIAEGRLPAAAVYADPGFRRALRGVEVPLGIHLHYYAVDLVRTPDGGWCVLDDRTQAPSGSGYSLENRVVLSRVLPDCFRHCNVQRLAPFFERFRESLMALAPPHREQPRCVLLTPGPYNETYFEHVYLARYLGLTLVEGADLTVRDRQVFMKTLSGLEPVDVIFRRLDGDYCDPLELRSDSSLGVAGLVQAIRAGTVAIANAIGAGILESLAIKPYLPALCQRLLGEDPKLPEVATLWCGDPGRREQVLENLTRLVIKPAFPSRAFDPVMGAQLSEARRADLERAIRAKPWNHVAQEQPVLSTAPVWQGGRMQPRPLVLRVFLCARPDGSYIAMPGGLTRIAGEPGNSVISMQMGSGSKDTWVLAPRRVASNAGIPRAPVMAPVRPVAARTASANLPSRVADGLYWFGRYMERCEWAVRLVRGVQTRVTDGNLPGASEEMKPLLTLMAWLGMIPWDLAKVAENGSNRTLRSALNASIFDAEHPNSLRTNVQRLQRTAYSVRDRLSLDLWRVVSTVDRLSLPPRGRLDSAGLLLRLDDMITSLAALSGLEQESMTRGPGWHFLDMGRRIERAVHMVSVMRGVSIGQLDRLPEVEQAAALEVLLELGESFMTYRERYLATVQRAPVLALLLTDETNPRALAFQLTSMARHLDALPKGPGEPGEDPTGPARQIVVAAQAALASPSAVEHGPTLTATLAGIALSLPEISNALAKAYFSHAFTRPG